MDIQHCEIKAFANAHPFISRFINWGMKPRKGVLDATLHPSVEERFKCKVVSQSGETNPYRPETLREDKRFQHLYEA